MGKTIRFPLVMEHGEEVRSIDELREHFSIRKVIEYLESGKLITWLRHRYENDIADSLEQLSCAKDELPEKICEIFGVAYDENQQVDMEKIEERNRKLSILKEYTTEKKYIDVVDFIAFDQDELYDLLDEEADTIYLCGEKFNIPLSLKDKTYEGINNPVVVVDSKKEVDWDENRIRLLNVRYDDKYQAVVDSAEQVKAKLYQKAVEEVKAQEKTDDSSGFDWREILSSAEKKASKELFGKLTNVMDDVKFNIDDDIKEMKKALLNANLIGCAEEYLSNL